MTHHGDWLAALVDGELEGGKRSRLQRHLGVCGQCREEFAALALLKARLVDLPRPSPPKQLMRRLLLAAELESHRCSEDHRFDTW